MSIAYRLAVSESLRLSVKFYDVPRVFTCKEGENELTDLTLKKPSSNCKCVNMFFDIIENVPCLLSMGQVGDVLALDETEVPDHYCVSFH